MEHSFNGSPSRATAARKQSPSPLRPVPEKKKGAVQVFREAPKGESPQRAKSPASQLKGQNSQQQMTELIAMTQNEHTERGEVSVAVMDNMVERAKKKFNKLDKDDSGTLEGEEVEELAAWVWNKFHPGGKEIESDVRDVMATKLLERLDENDDKSISFVEFEAWFKRTCVSIQRFRSHKARPDGSPARAKTPSPSPNKTAKTTLPPQAPSVPASPVTLDDIEKPEDRLRRLNRELVDAQEAMLASPDKQERKRLRRKCRELDKELGGEHEGYREWKSSLNSSQASELGDSSGPGGYTDRFSSPMKARNTSPARPVQGFFSSAAKPVAPVTAPSSNFATKANPEYEPMAAVDVDPVVAPAGAEGEEKARASEEAEVVFGVSQSPVQATPEKPVAAPVGASPSQKLMDQAIADMGNNSVETGEVSVAVMDKMVSRARKKFNKLDRDASGVLEGHEVEELASWVWGKFHPGGAEIDVEIRKANASKLLTQMDTNNDGNISFEEFEAWFKRTCVDIQRKQLHGAKSVASPSPAKPGESKPPLPSPSPAAPNPAVAPKAETPLAVPESPAEAASSPALGFFKGSKQHAPDPFPSALEAGTGAWFSSEKDGKWFSAEAREPAAGDDGPWFNKNGVWGKEDKLLSSEKANEARPSPAELRNQSPADLIRQTNSPGGFFRGASSAAGASPAH